MPIRFRWRPIPLVATVIVAAAGIMLAQWQTRRGDEKQLLQDRMTARLQQAAVALDPAMLAQDPKENEFRRIRLRGEFIPAWTVYLDNRPYRGVAGFYVLTPFKIAGSERAVLLERGWVARDPDDRGRLPQLPLPSGTVDIDGVLRLDAGHLLQLGSAPAPQPGAILQNLDLAALARASALPLVPFVVEQSSNGHDAADGLVRDWPPPALGIERHRGYTVQWYALALMAIIFFVVTGLRSGKK